PAPAPLRAHLSGGGDQPAPLRSRRGVARLRRRRARCDRLERGPVTRQSRLRSAALDRRAAAARARLVGRAHGARGASPGPLDGRRPAPLVRGAEGGRVILALLLLVAPLDLEQYKARLIQIELQLATG